MKQRVKYLHKGHSIEITYMWILYVYSHILTASVLEHLMITTQPGKLSAGIFADSQ